MMQEKLRQDSDHHDRVIERDEAKVRNQEEKLLREEEKREDRERREE